MSIELLSMHIYLGRTILILWLSESLRLSLFLRHVPTARQLKEKFEEEDIAVVCTLQLSGLLVTLAIACNTCTHHYWISEHIKIST
jgi:hypothetical protein